MSIALNGHVYDVVEAMDGKPMVIVQHSASLWREADPRTALKVLAGLSVSYLRLAA